MSTDSIPGTKLPVDLVRPAYTLVDVLGGAARREIKIGEHGLVALVDVMPRLVPEGQTADSAIVQAARVSYGSGTKSVSDDASLIRYLMRHKHTSPTEMVEFKFHCQMPIFVARQWIRHRTGSFNEVSARYSEVKDEFYRPAADAVRRQSTLNKQGSEDFVDDWVMRDFFQYLERGEEQHGLYQKLLLSGVARELARIGLPLSCFTAWYWKVDLHNLFHFLSLRMDAHAQEEMRVYALAIFQLIQPLVPVAAQAFLDYRLNAMTLSALEVEALHTGDPLAATNKRELSEWENKRDWLGL